MNSSAKSDFLYEFQMRGISMKFQGNFNGKTDSFGSEVKMEVPCSKTLSNSRHMGEFHPIIKEKCDYYIKLFIYILLLYF